MEESESKTLGEDGKMKFLGVKAPISQLPGNYAYAIL